MGKNNRRKENPVASVIGGLRLADGLAAMAFTTASGALPVVGADLLTIPATDAAAGRFVFTVETALMKLRLALKGSGAGATARVWTAKRLEPTADPGQWTLTHVVDIAASASTLAAGVASGLADATVRWGTAVMLSNDGGLPPVRTRLVGGVLADSPQDVLIDCAGEELVVVDLRDSLLVTAASVLAQDVTRD